MTEDQLKLAVQAARRVIAEKDTEMHIDPYRLAWACDMVAYFDTRDAAIAARLHIETAEKARAAA